MTKVLSLRPLSIKMVAVLYLLEAFPEFLRVLAVQRLWVLGFQITGEPVVVLHLLLTTCYVWVGLRVWQLRESARRIAICHRVLTILEVMFRVVYFVGHPSPEIAARIQRLVQAGHVHLSHFIVVAVAAAISAPSLLEAGVVIWFLVKRKSAFVKKTHTQ